MTVLRDVELSLVSQALELSGGNRSQAARMLGLNRTTLVMKLAKFGIQDRRFESEAERATKVLHDN